MKKQQNIKTHKHRPIKGLLFVLMLLLFAASSAFAQLKPVYVTGKIIDDFTGMPISYKQIFLETDTAFGSVLEPVYLEAFTNSEGIYTFTVNSDIVELHLVIYTFDCNDERHDTTFALNVSQIEPSYYSFDFHICKKVYGNCMPNFEAELIDSTEENFIYQFHDLSETDIVLWKWEFGDGNSASEQHPDHVYFEEGLYDVTLIVSNSLYPNMGCKDSITKQINVGNGEFYNFGGHVFAGYFPVDLAYAYLYQIDDEELIPVDTAVIDTLGFYYFYQKPAGQYVLKTSLQTESEHFGAYLPTYYGDKMYWQDAHAINLTGENWQYDVELIEVQPMIQGIGNLSGETVYIDSLKNVIGPATNIELFLLNGQNQVCKYTHSNYLGDFFFTEIPYDTYTLRAEAAGLNCEPLELIISEGQPHHTDLVMEIETQEVSSGINEKPDNWLEIKNGIYPNPADHLVNVDLTFKRPGFFSLEVFNQVGKQVVSLKEERGPGLHTIPVDIHRLTKGLYFIRVTSEDKISYIEKLIVL